MHLKHPFIQNVCIKPLLFIFVFMLTIGNPQFIPQVEAQSTPTIIDVRVASSSDDAEQNMYGQVLLTNSDLELIQDGPYTQTVGVRFTNLNIPPGAQITNAYVQFKVDEYSTGIANLTIQAEATGNASTFSYSRHNIANRTKTSASTNWAPAPWTVVGQAGSNQQTPDLSTVIQEVVDRQDWSVGNAMAFIITGSGRRTAEAYDGDIDGAPLLHVEFIEPVQTGGGTTQIDPLPTVTGTNAGYLAGSFGVNEGGSASYSMDLAVPPGTSGVAPKLSLSYDSRGRSSVLGSGWSLAGLSAITRCGTTLAQDGFIDGIDFDGNDKFCLDGQRLVAINGVYGANGTEYRTENETFAQIFSYGTAGSGPERFVVKTKAGLIYSYGGTTDSRVEAEGKTDVLLWHADKVSDTTGNYFTITYHEDNAIGESYPLRIDYTGNAAQGLIPYNSVQFSYEARTDIIPRFLAGSMMKLTKRLNKISMYTDQNLAWEYNLSYDPNNDSRSSRLVSVEECDANNECLPRTEFDWDLTGEVGKFSKEYQQKVYGTDGDMW
ncbi:MAG: hypothetical protein KC733_11950, partial [Candidatus Omnitrophica bacterium]|nr:hypothetical protein [Candidatus Omnitrophota bacterium]